MNTKLKQESIDLSNNINTEVISVKEVKEAVFLLKANKNDGNLGFNSSHIINASPQSFALLTLLFNACIKHCFIPCDMLVSTIVSIPKDLRESLMRSDNYRGIALTSAMYKILDIIIFNKYQDKLQSSNLQFAYKKGHSTNICTLALKEIVHHYVSRGSSVYCCLLDASKAFDRINLLKLFEILRERNIPPDIIRLLIHMSLQQNIRVTWGNVYSDYFNGSNGIRQGSVLSPILFTLYIDKLIEELNQAKLGCHIGNKYTGCVAYADDITLISPSATGLQAMVHICERFGINWSVKFNEKKSICIYFKNHKLDEMPPVIMMANKRLAWSNQVKHLGNFITNNLSENTDIIHKANDMTFQFNKLMSNFSHANIESLKLLFNQHCTAFYGAETWRLSAIELKLFYTRWNKIVRKLLSLPYTTHTKLLPQLLNTLPIAEQILKRFFSLYRSINSSDNKVIKSIFDIFKNDASSIYGSNALKISHHFSAPIHKICIHFFNKCKLQYDPKTNIINELMLMRQGDLMSNLSEDDVNEMLHELCTN